MEQQTTALDGDTTIVVSNWLPRMVAQGLDVNDVQRVIATVGGCAGPTVTVMGDDSRRPPVASMAIAMSEYVPGCAPVQVAVYGLALAWATASVPA